jgi:hypothetical protein
MVVVSMYCQMPLSREPGKTGHTFSFFIYHQMSDLYWASPRQTTAVIIGVDHESSTQLCTEFIEWLIRPFSFQNMLCAQGSLLSYCFWFAMGNLKYVYEPARPQRFASGNVGSISGCSNKIFLTDDLC